MQMGWEKRLQCAPSYLHKDVFEIVKVTRVVEAVGGGSRYVNVAEEKGRSRNSHEPYC